jgi:hypothetical protein
MDRTKRYDILAGGISIGSEEVTAGTLSGLFQDLMDGSVVLISNLHVFQGKPGKTLILQPGKYDGGKAPDDVVGVLKRYVPVNGYENLPWWLKTLVLLFGWLFGPGRGPNYVDAAVATFRPSDPSRSVTRGVYLEDGRIIFPWSTMTGDGIAGRKVWKVGRTTGLTIGEVIDDSATVKVWYGDRWARFDDQILVKGQSQGGDSGSPTFVMLGDQPSEDDAFVGLLFAGGDGTWVTCKYKYIMELLKVKWG